MWLSSPLLRQLILSLHEPFFMTADPWAPVLKNETNWSGVKLDL